MCRDTQPVAMAPDAAHVCRAIAAAGLSAVAGRVHVEIAGQVAFAFRIAPEVQRHGGYGLRADQLAHGVDHRTALLVPGLDRCAQHAALHLAGVLGQLAVAADEGSAEICAARDVVPPDVRCAQGCELLHAPVLHIGRQGGARAAQAGDARKIAALRQLYPGLHAVGIEGCASAEAGDCVARCKAPEHTPVGLLLAAAGAAVIDHTGRAPQLSGA